MLSKVRFVVLKVVWGKKNGHVPRPIATSNKRRESFFNVQLLQNLQLRALLPQSPLQHHLQASKCSPVKFPALRHVSMPRAHFPHPPQTASQRSTSSEIWLTRRSSLPPAPAERSSSTLLHPAMAPRITERRVGGESRLSWRVLRGIAS